MIRRALAALLLALAALGASAQVSIWTARPGGFITSGGVAGGPILLTDGTSTNQSLKWITDGFGFYRSNTNILTISNSAGTKFFTLDLSTASIVNRSDGIFAWASSADSTATQDLMLARDAANTLAQRNGTNAQGFRIFNTYTDASNHERGEVVWGSNTFTLQTTAVGTGTARSMIVGPTGSGTTLTLQSAGTSRWQITSGGTLTALADNTYDIGATGATRPSSVYVANGVNAFRFNANQGAGAPTMGACGTSPTITGKDSGFLVTVGTGAVATSCAVNFSATWTNPPVCVAQNNTDKVSYSIVTTATVVTISAAVAFTASSKFHVICIGQ